MNKLFNGLDYVRKYIDDLLIISDKSLEDHIKKLDKVLNELKSVDFKVNAEKHFFTRNELKYLDFKITKKGIKPLQDKVEAIKNIVVPTTKKQLQSFTELIDYYRDMWKHRSDILTALSSITSTQAKWYWSKEYKNAFDKIKKTISRETLLSYPNFNKPFEIHTALC